MCECQTIQTNASTRQYDPTRTTALRNAFAANMIRRFKELISVINKTVVERDAFGLTTNQMTSPLPGAFAFPLSTDKVEAFMEWLQAQIDAGILEVTSIQSGNVSRYAWTNMYILDSYKRGLIRARIELKKAGYDVPPMDIDALMGTPFHLDRVGLLFIRAFEELKGVTNDMSKQISKILAQGMVDGDGPALIARKLRAVVDGTSAADLGITDSLGRYIPAKRRAEMIARTETIRAHHQATINEYMSWGAEGVSVKAEFRTAGDNRVCSECSSLEGETFDLETAMYIIPVHPMCRCICLPIKMN